MSVEFLHSRNHEVLGNVIKGYSDALYPMQKMFKIGAPIYTWKFIGQVTLAKNLVFVPLGNSNKVKWYLVTYLNGCLLRSGYLFISTISNSRPLNNILQMHRGGKTFYRGAIIGRMT